MVERRPWLTFTSHLVLILGVLVVAFPLYLTWVASTQSAQQIHQGNPMSLWPGDEFWDTYRLTLFGGVSVGRPRDGAWSCGRHGGALWSVGC